LIGKADQDAANFAVSTFPNSKWDVCDTILKIFGAQLLLQGFLMGDLHCFQESEERGTNFGWAFAASILVAPPKAELSH